MNFQEAMQNQALGGLGGQGLAGLQTAEYPEMPIFRKYCDAKAEYQAAQKNLLAANERMANAGKIFIELTAQVDQLIRSIDPRNPQPATPNGTAYGGTRY